MIRFLIALSSILFSVANVNPPIWAEHFTQVFIETYPNKQVHVPGNLHYDSTKNMSRVDRVDGQYQQICGSIQPDIKTACNQLVRDGKRWVIFPQKRACCMCCTQEKGCGILRRDWLKGASYEGSETISGQDFDRWSIPDGSSTDYYWSTQTQKQIARKMNEGNTRIKDFIMNSYNEDPIDESVFALPSYCKDTCSPTTICGKFQSSEESSQIIDY